LAFSDPRHHIDQYKKNDLLGLQNVDVKRYRGKSAETEGVEPLSHTFINQSTKYYSFIEVHDLRSPFLTKHKELKVG